MTKDEVLSQEELLRKAMLENDINQLEQLLADELTFVTQLGQIITKKDDLASHQAGNLHLTKIEFLDQKIKLLNCAAITTTKVQLRGMTGLNEIDDILYYTRIWKKIDGQIQVIHGHCSIVAE